MPRAASVLVGTVAVGVLRNCCGAACMQGCLMQSAQGRSLAFGTCRAVFEQGSSLFPDWLHLVKLHMRPSMRRQRSAKSSHDTSQRYRTRC